MIFRPRNQYHNFAKPGKEVILGIYQVNPLKNLITKLQQQYLSIPVLAASF